MYTRKHHTKLIRLKNTRIDKLFDSVGGKNMTLKKLLAIVSVCAMTVSMATGCAADKKEEVQKTEVTQEVTEQTEEVTEEVTETVEEEAQEETVIDNEVVDVALLKGPTGIGAASLMKESAEGRTKINYNFYTEAAPEDVISRVVSGEIEIAAIPTNAASALFNKTEGGIEVLALNTMGTLYLLERGETINSLEDLSGKTIYSTGQGAVPEYVFKYILAESGAENVIVEYMQTHQELAAALASGMVDNALLPEPYVEVALSKAQDARIALDLAECYDEVTGFEKGNMPNTLPMGCVIAKKDFIENNPEKVKVFLEEYKDSIKKAEDVTKTAELVVEFGIIENQAVAEKAIPKCSIYYIDGEEMKTLMGSFLEVLFNANPKAIGGKMPTEDFYYIAE